MKRQPRQNAPWEAAFDEFWEFFPYKVNIGQAESTYKQLFESRLLPVNLILKIASKVQQRPGGCLERRELIRGTDSRPHPSTWLNGKRWLDAYDPPILPTADREMGMPEGRREPGEINQDAKEKALQWHRNQEAEREAAKAEFFRASKKPPA